MAGFSKQNCWVILLFLIGVSCAYGQQENFVGEATLPASTAAAATSGAIVVAQATSDADSVSESAEAGNEDTEESDYEEGDLVDQYSLPRSSAPIAVDQSLISGSPIGQNTQRAVSKPPGVAVDSSIGFFPALTLGYSWSDNPAREEDPEDDSSFEIVPNIVLRSAINNRHLYEIGVAGSVDAFDQLSNLDETDILYYAAINLDISDKVQGDLYANYEEGSDPRGSTGSRIIDESIENDEYDRTLYGGRLTVGRRSNTLQIVLLAEHENIDYTNNNQDSRDRTDDTIGAGLYWNVGPRTSVFLNTERTDIDYDLLSSNGFDSTETRNTIGIGWEPSFNTSMIFEIGNLNKDLEDPTLEDYDDETYSGRLSWTPKNNFTMGFYGSKTTEETVDRASPFTVSELLGVDASYSFTDRFRAYGYYNLIDDDLVNVREDDITDYGVGLYYDLTKWLTLGGSWQHTDRNSTDPTAEYEENIYSITATIRSPKTVEFDTLQIGEDLNTQQ